jgi:hypothetical protein
MNGMKIKTEYKKGIKLRASGCSTVVQHLPHHPKVEGLSLATSDSTRDRKCWQRFVNLVPYNFYNTGTNLINNFTYVNKCVVLKASASKQAHKLVLVS